MKSQFMNGLAEPVLIAIGANLPGSDGRHPRATCIAAAEALRDLPGLRFCALSPWYETEPIPPGGPRYVNGVALLQGQPDPAWLLARLQRIELLAGRLRSVPNAPRTLDLDIIAIGSLLRDSPDPVLPHPRAHLRAFVLRPVLDVAPFWVHPRLGQSGHALEAALGGQVIRRMG